ncbi:pilus assembly protein [Arthrobacter sp. NEB 688]|nr:pilus assembly protein [Arthrobacter sp. NEB 688]
MTAHPSRTSERGSATLEAAIGVPAFMLFVGLIIVGGRMAIAHQALESAAADAARAASISRSQASAEHAASEAARSSVTNQHLACATPRVSVDTSGFRSRPGTPATATVTISCRVPLADLAVPGVPGSRIVTATSSSPIDTYRERR